MKLFVLEHRYLNADGDYVQIVKTFKAKPHRFSYIIFI